MANTVQIQNNVHLERLMTTDREFEQYMKTAIGYVLEQARKDVVSEAASKLENDPRNAARAVRRTLYRQVLGGQINILQKKKAGRRGSVPGGNRGRLARTEQLMSYQGSDRGFVLRFINAGTKDRVAKHMNGHSIRRTSTDQRFGNKADYKTTTVGSRGSITGKNFFGPAAQAAIQEASRLLQVEFDKIVQKYAQ